MNPPPVDPAQLTWDEARDSRFFSITTQLFSPQFCFGASTLLGSYEDSSESAPEPLPARWPDPFAATTAARRVTQ
ncbi:MAG: hypothetical protein QOD70_328 [Frankiales bacterium]|jgi:hypothetical protein|nr:hypothetical protein [Frankiales bacterium]